MKAKESASQRRTAKGKSKPRKAKSGRRTSAKTGRTRKKRAKVAGIAAHKVQLLEQFCFSRKDIVAFDPPWGKPCPCEAGDTLPALLAAHVAGDQAREVEVYWRSKKASGSETGRFRVGS